MPVLRWSHRAGDGGRVGRDGAHGAPRLGEGKEVASAGTRRMTSSADHSADHWKRVASYLDSGALVFAAPLLKAGRTPPEGTLGLAEPIAQFVRQAARRSSSSDSAPD